MLIDREAKDKNHLKHAFMQNTLEQCIYYISYTTVTVFILKSMFLKFIFSFYHRSLYVKITNRHYVIFNIKLNDVDIKN